jgi:hypothetical protein
MGAFKNRSDYFKSFAEQHLQIAHNVELRNSFFRLNDEVEFDAAAANFSNFPCMVHWDSAVRYRRDKPSLPRRITSNTVTFLSRLDEATYPAKSDAIEIALDQAFTIMEDFIAWLVYDIDNNVGECGELFLLDLGRTAAHIVGPFNGNLIGWEFSFTDEKPGAKYFADRFIS